jgi:hypothetical protein
MDDEARTMMKLGNVGVGSFAGVDYECGALDHLNLKENGIGS